MTLSQDFTDFGEGQDKRAQRKELRRGEAIDRRFARIGKSIQTFWGPVVLIDFALGFSLIVVGYTFAGGMPGGVLTAAAMVAVGLLRRPTVRVRWGGILFVVMFLLLVYLAVESRYNHMAWQQRDLKFFLILSAAAVLGSGRINTRSFLIGGLAGAVVNAPAFYLHLTPNDYPPYLTGYYLDKNVAGMYYALWGILGLLVLPKKWQKWWILFAGILLFLTGSRTSLAAYGLGLAWYAVRARFGLTFRIILAIIGFQLLRFFENNLANASVFGNRTGDDWFRQQIDAAMAAKVAITPWYGMGLNSGWVQLSANRTIWFHDSYQQAFVEGGYPFLWVILAAFILVGMGIFDRRIVLPQPLVPLEGAVVVILVCAWKLGEVFMTLGAFIVLGLCMAYRLGIPLDLPRKNPFELSPDERAREARLHLEEERANA